MKLATMFCCFNKPITCETLVQERHFTSGRWSFDLESLLLENRTLADSDLMNKTIKDAKELVFSKKNDIHHMKAQIEYFLKFGRDNDARLKKNLICVLENVITFCELIDRRLPSIDSKPICPCHPSTDQSQREVPPDMIEAIATLCYIGSKYGELPILAKVRSHFSRKYGEKYIVNLTKCANAKIKKRLLIPSPTEDKQNKVLTKIAKRRNINWCGIEITEALRLQMEVQKRLHEQLEIQRNLQL
ncbi:unnamed protein product [Trifolium pratense]|uniref:Uncharacterized protein n=1 Tax=Trifolium pratense TaxID=57577 RepID=A0ACB0ILG5_TRIPR|nr:unnamed protein product [Trifolium pratense]